MDPNAVAAFLKDEYIFLQNTYEDFDKRALMIKNWSVTVSLVALGLGVQYKTPLLWALACGATILFWIIEAKWKSFQYAFAPRIKEIERYFRGEPQPETMLPFQVYSSWSKKYNQQPAWKATLSNAVLPMVALPHLLILSAGIGLLFAYYALGMSPWN
jgi:hypothetical protein